MDLETIRATYKDEGLSDKTQHFPAANTDAVATIAAEATGRRGIYGILFGYDGEPTGGELTVEGCGDSFTIPISNAGPQHLPIHKVLWGDVNTDVVVTLAAGGAGVSGWVIVFHD